MKKNDLCPKKAGKTYGKQSRFCKRQINRNQDFFYHNGPKHYMKIIYLCSRESISFSVSLAFG
jgi:hypothetical protein